MRIKTMYATFGKLNEARLDLSEGMNVLYGENESGKSTWSAFLRVMLYGISTKERTKAGAMADKEKYAPWSGKPMYGKIEFSWQGKDYTMERVSGRGGILQAAKIVEDETGKIMDIPEPVGETLLGIRREVFERTAFIAQSQLAITGDKTGELEKRICALATTGEEDVSQKQVIDRLDKEKRALDFRGKGDIPAISEELFRINETIKIAREEAVALTVLHTEIEELTAKEEKAVRDIETAKIRDARRNLDYIKNAKEELSSAEKEQEEHLANEKITASQLAEVENKFKQFEEKKRSYTECYNRFMQENSKEREILPENAGAKPFVIAMLCALLVAVSALFIKWFIAVPVAVLAFVVIFFVMNRAFYKKLGVQNKAELNLKREEALRSAQTVAILEEECQRSEKEMLSAGENLVSLLKMLGDGYSAEDVPQIIAEANAYQLKAKELAQKVETLSAKYEALKMGRDLEELEKLAAKPIDGGEVFASEESLRALIAQARAEREVRVTQLAAKTERIQMRGELGALEVRKKELEEALAEKKSDFEALELASKLLSEIQNELARKFAPSVEKRAGEIFEYLTGEHFKIVRIEDAEMSLKVAENDASLARNILELSGGTLDELYLAVRLALCEALLTNDVPILLDDALVNFDDLRAQRALKFLQKLANDRQIMVLSCHLRETKFAKENEITSLTL